MLPFTDRIAVLIAAMSVLAGGALALVEAITVAALQPDNPAAMVRSGCGDR